MPGIISCRQLFFGSYTYSLTLAAFLGVLNKYEGCVVVVAVVLFNESGILVELVKLVMFYGLLVGSLIRVVKIIYS